MFARPPLGCYSFFVGKFLEFLKPFLKKVLSGARGRASRPYPSSVCGAESPTTLSTGIEKAIPCPRVLSPTLL